MSSRRLKIPAINETSRADGSRAGGIQAYWTGEAVATTTSKPGFGMVEFNAHKLTVVVYITEELQEDRAALGPFVQTLAAQELAFKLDDAIVNGDGSGKPLGLLNAPATISVAKESGQTADTVNYANVRKMRARVFSGSRAGYVWLINQEVESQLEQMLLSGSLSDIAVYMPANGISQAPFATLYGRPLIMVEQAPKLGDKGDINAVDLSRYILARHTSGVQTAASIHVKFLEGEPVFRIRMRVDGQPWWKSALTKYKGNDTVSPYVTLAERA